MLFIGFVIVLLTISISLHFQIILVLPIIVSWSRDSPVAVEEGRADHAQPTAVEVKKMWTYGSASTYLFMA
jgi:hypothetical protein